MIIVTLVGLILTIWVTNRNEDDY